MPLPPNIVEIKSFVSRIEADIVAPQENFAYLEVLLQRPTDTQPQVVFTLLPGEDRTYHFTGLDDDTTYTLGARTVVGYGDFAEQSEIDTETAKTCKYYL